MSLADLKLEYSYNNQECDVVNEFLNPVLKEAVRYDRAVGFFSSTSLMAITVGIKEMLTKPGCKIRMICSPKLSTEDIEAIQEGYEKRKVIEEALLREFEDTEDKFEKERLNLLSHLISEGYLDIKIATMTNEVSTAMFHIKLGIVYDENSNFVVFNGSMNDSSNAYYLNNESIDVYSSLSSDYMRACQKKDYFNRLWNEGDANTQVVEFPKAVIEKIDNYRQPTYSTDIDQRERKEKEVSKKPSSPSTPGYIKIRNYQQSAYDEWKANGYRGIYNMCTGAGKTISALYAVTNLLKERKGRLGIIICCPYQHLVTQWAEDLDEFNFKYIMGYSSSPQKNWKDKLKKEVFNYTHKIAESFCFITTNASFATPAIQKILNSIKGETLIIIDEAHNFGTNRLVSLLDDKYTYRLALSATLERHNDLVGTQRLYDFFEKECAKYTLEQAISDEKLCNYYYYPIPVYFEEDELENYNKLTEELSKYIIKKPDGSIEYSKKAEMLLIKRSRIVAGARGKLDKLREILPQFVGQNHLLVYCGSTTVVDPEYVEGSATDEELRQIDAVTRIINDAGITPAQFTSQEVSATREMLKRSFDDGSVIQAMVAIRCLDEGVNIPSIDKAIIMASSTNPKEYVQRRGRVLRTYPGKDFAKIYDFITLPRDLDTITDTTDTDHDLGLVKREITRAKDFARLSMNEYYSDDIISKIEDVYGYFITEGDNYE